MTAVVLVHGIFNRERALTPGEAAAGKAVDASSRLEAGLKAAGLAHVSTPEMVMAYYAHQLADDWEAQADGHEEYALDGLSPAQLADAWEWLRAAGVPDQLEPQGHLTAPVRWGLGQLAARRTGVGAMGQIRQRSFELLSRLVVATLQDTDAYTSRPERRRAVRATVAQAIDASSPQVVVAHSLGSVVAYETLHAYPELQVELLVTLGSPLGLPAIMRKLEPEPRSGMGARPAGVQRWVNIADVGDLIAVPPELGGAFPVDQHATTHIGPVDSHTLGGYLADGLVAAAIAPYVVP